MTRRSSLLAAATAALIAISGLTPVAANAAAGSVITSGALDWPISASYLAYVEGPAAQGVVAPADGAVRTNTGSISWPIDSGTFDSSTGALDVSFAGSVEFSGHHGLMNLKLSDLRIESTAYGAATVYADYSSDNSGTVATGDDVAIASISDSSGTITVPEDSLTWADLASTLLTDGATAFGGFYPVGQSLSPVNLTAVGDWAAFDRQPTTEKPTFSTQPADLTVEIPAGASSRSARFSVAVAGDPAPSVQWQKQPAGAAGFSDIAGATAPVLDLTVSAADNASTYRAVASNTAGTTQSKTAILTVTRAPGGTAPGVFTNATFEWGVNSEVQRQPFSGTSNYLSAGVSDGTSASYRTSSGDVSIVQRTGSTETTPTYATRAAHIAAKGRQVVRYSGGDAVVNADGSATVQFTGSYSVNMYDGLVPFTLTDPTLAVAANGTGTLTADLSGYSGEIGDATSKKPIAPVADVTIATFSGVTVDTTSGIVVTPAYSGVRVALPSDATQQNTTVSGWGSWPQPFVDFQVATGLSSYWYSSGSALDAHKAPAAFSVGFGGAFVASPPPTATTPTKTTTGSKDDSDDKPGSPADSDDATNVKGSLTWGIKSSFRSYITGTIAKGSISVSDGAKRAPSGAFTFGQLKGGTFDADTKRGTSRYDGTVRFSGHSGLLALSIGDPTVKVTSADSATLSVVINGTRTDFATINLKAAERSEREGAVTYRNAPVALAAGGVAAFSYNGSSFYSVGTAMDAVTFTIGKPAAATGTESGSGFSQWAPPSTPPTSEGITLDSDDTITAGGSVAFTASGFEAGETGIRAVIYSEPTVLATDITADANGVVNSTVTIPAALTGEHTLTLQGSVDRGIAITIAEADSLEGCPVTNATIEWGFKESFRSYISGSIANGEWETTGDAGYETPNFTWSEGSGPFDAEAYAAEIDFSGSVHFTGHDGALDMTVSNPRISILDESTAALLVDVSSKAMDSDEVVEQTAVRFVELDLAGATVTNEAGSVTVTDAAATLTDEGSAGFAGFYGGGEAFDPVSFTLPVGTDCAVAAPAPEPTEAPVAPTDTTDASAGFAMPIWVVIALGIALLLAIAAIVVLLVSRRRVKA